MTFSFEVWGEEFEGRPRTRAAHGSYVTVHVAGNGRQSSRWPDSWRAALTV
jgi:acyl-CoA thioester hydrolase